MSENKENNITPMMAQYFSIKENYKDCLLFYRMGDFYELFFEDAVIASKALDIVLTSRGKHKEKEIPMCGVPFHSYENYMARIIKKGFKVAICEQTEDPKEAKKQRGAGAIVRREVVRLVTAGTLTEDNILNSKSNNYLMAIYGKDGTFGICYSDISTLILNVTSKYGEDALYDFVHKICPAEIVVSDDFDEELLFDFKKILTKLPKTRFSYEKLMSSLKNNIENDNLEVYGSFLEQEEIALAVLVDYVETTQKGLSCKFSQVLKVDEKSFMEIPSATRISLEIFNSNNDDKNTSLKIVLDETVTSLGARKLNEILLRPLIDRKEIIKRHDTVEFFINYQDFLKSLRGVLKDCYDIERSLSRLSFSRGGPRDMLMVLKTVSTIPKIKDLFNINKNNHGFIDIKIPDILKEAKENLPDFKNLSLNLQSALKEEVPMLARDGGFIKKGYDEAFDIECMKRDEGMRFIAGLQKKYQEETGISSLKIAHNNMLGYYIEVTAKFSEKLLLDKEKFIHRQTLANNMRFTTIELSNLEDELKKSHDKALAIELIIYDKLLQNILSEATCLMNTAKTIALLDVLSSFSVIALNYGYVRPEMTDDYDFIIEKGRHPIVERYMKNFMPNDCNIDAKSRIWLITGPNMAGKSTFLRQNALIAIMAQIGSFVPASKAKIGVIDKIFSRVGASDDLAHGRSTFMVEMIETAVILNQSTAKSLVILDEIGRGTSTFDGLSIAWSSLEYLHDKNKSRSLFATHYHELTVLSNTLANLDLYTIKVKEWEGNIVFLHEIIKGIADRSYGVHVAKLAGMPKLVLTRANIILKQLESKGTGTTSLPLFAMNNSEESDLNKEFYEKYNDFISEIKKINPDSFSPKEALDYLYKIKDSI